MFNLIIDTREQSPLTFRSTDNYSIIAKKLDFGDYGLELDNKLICVFERKSSSDLYGTLTSGHERFKDEILRAKDSNVPFIIIIEESYHNIINKKFEKSYLIRSMKGYIIAKMIHTMSIKYNVQFIFCNNREEMRDYIRNTFNSYIKLLLESNKNDVKT